jgi:plasmid stabilization system protein ParE
MRTVVYADTFVAEADDITCRIESFFGLSRANKFRDDLERFCEALAKTPGRGKIGHGYRTPLSGVVFDRNWIFFRIEGEAVQFVHIVQSRRLKESLGF